jgi:hypothetical protein
VAVAEVVMVLPVVLQAVQVAELINRVEQQVQVILPQSVHLKEVLEELVKKTEVAVAEVLLM